MIKIVCVGKIKESFLEDGIKEYQKRMEAWQKIQIIEVKETNTFSIERNIEEEGQKLLQKIAKDDWVITLEILGKNLTSNDFAKTINDLYTYGKTNLTFVIGGSNGLSDEVKRRGDLRLSFSTFTFPHQLMRLILMEQIYRAFTIINNKEYHK